MRGRRFRLGVRTRLLLTVAGAVSIALLIGVTAFNLLLDQRLTDSEIALAHGQATAEASALQVVDGQLMTPGRPDKGVKIGSPVWVFAGKRPLETPRVSPSLDALARSLADGPERTVRVKEEIRLYALPVVHDGARVGTVVAGVPLEPYDETATIAFVGSIALAVLLLGAVTLLSRWILGKALLPVSRMTGTRPPGATTISTSASTVASHTTSSPNSLPRSMPSSSVCPPASGMSNASPRSSPTSCERRSRELRPRPSLRCTESEAAVTTVPASKPCIATPSR